MSDSDFFTASEINLNLLSVVEFRVVLDSGSFHRLSKKRRIEECRPDINGLFLRLF